MNRIQFSFLIVYYYAVLLFDFCCDGVMSLGTAEQKQYVVGIGVVQDQKSSFGSMVNLCMDMAISEFYGAHPKYRTRLQLHKKDARKLVDANLAVLELVQNKEIASILGPQGSTEEAFAAAVGETVQVPIISFTARSSTLSHTENRYFVRVASDDAGQAQALASICQRFKWPKVFILYEDTERGNLFLLYTIKALHDVDIGLENMTAIPTSAEDSHIRNKLNELSKNETKVFLVHLNPGLGSRLFSIANNIGMMSEGYAWVITDSISIFMDSIDSDSRDSLDGVLGVRPYVHTTKEMRSFQERFKRNMHLKISVPTMELNVYGLWAFESVTALAIAVENVGPLLWNSTNNENGTNCNTTSSLGPSLLNELSSTRFRGLTGDFHLVEGKLKSSTLEIFNSYGTGEKRVGFWTPERGISRELSTSNKDLKNIMWPGDSVVEDFHHAMSNGSVDVIIEEIPYMKLFLKKYEPKYKMLGPIYRTDGFGFAFPVGSFLVSNFSRAILKVTQSSEMMSKIERNNFGPGYSSLDQLYSVVSQGSSSLSLSEFAGLFILIGSLSLFALFCSETPIGQRFTAMVVHLINGPEQVRYIEDASNDEPDGNDANSPPLHVGDGGSVELVRRDDDDDEELARRDADADNDDDNQKLARRDADADNDDNKQLGNEGS